jgi:hypothetical protein
MAESFWQIAARPFRRFRQYSSWNRKLRVEAPLTPAGLDKLYNEIDDRLDQDIRFLGLPVRWRRMSSNLLKLLALILFAAGVLLPLLFPERNTLTWLGERSGAEFALVAIVAGGLLLLGDQLFNLSHSWQRLMLSQMRVIGIRQSLWVEWQKRRPFVTDSGMKTDGVALIELLAASLKDTHQEMVAQKQAWASELDAALTDLRGRFDTQRGAIEKAVEAEKEEAAKPTTGAINVVIDKPEDLQGEMKLIVDGKVAATWPTPAAALSVGNIPAGLRSVQLNARKKAPPGTDFPFGQSIEVKAGAAATFSVKVV